MLKNILFCIVFFATTISIFSQPILNKSSFPEIGFEYTVVNCDTNNVSEGASGANVIWDFSDLEVLTSEPKTTQYVIAPSEGMNNSLFPSAEHALQADTGTTYLKFEGQVLTRLGIGFNEGAEVLTDPEDLMKFPFTYGDLHSDTFAGSTVVNIPGGSVTVERTATVDMEADAYGTVILPTGTFDNVLRVKFVQIITDKLPESQGGYSMVKEVVTYSYIQVSHFWPLVSITRFKMEYEGSPFPIPAVHSSSVMYGEYEAVSIQKPSIPALDGPADGSVDLELPITLDWSDSESGGIIKQKDDETQAEIIYTVHVSEDSEFAGDIPMEVESSISEITIKDIEVGKTYYWRVMATEGSESSDWSTPWSFSVKAADIEAPSAPVLSGPVNNAEETSTIPTFTWDEAADVEMWHLMVSSDMNFGSEIIIDEDDLTQGSYTIQDALEQNTMYYWRVRAFGNESWSDWSDVYSFTTENAQSVEMPVGAANVIISPLPANENINISFDSEIFGKAALVVADESGRTLVSMNDLQLNFGANSFKVSTRSLTSGVYYLTLSGNSLLIHERVIIRR